MDNSPPVESKRELQIQPDSLSATTPTPPSRKSPSPQPLLTSVSKETREANKVDAPTSDKDKHEAPPLPRRRRINEPDDSQENGGVGVVGGVGTAAGHVNRPARRSRLIEEPISQVSYNFVMKSIDTV